MEEPVVVYGMAPSAQARRSRPVDLGPGEVVRRIETGLPMSEFSALQELLGVSAETLAECIGMSRSTLARRRQSGRLSRDESDRLVRYTRLYARAEEVLGEGRAACSWFHVPLRGLGFATPLAFSMTEAGAREVENLLGRIEHGVFA